MTRPATLIDVTSGQIAGRIAALGVSRTASFDAADADGILQAARAATTGIMIYCGDGAGANRFGWLSNELPQVNWNYAALILPSSYADKSSLLGANVKDVDIFYAPFVTWPVPGQGSYKPLPLNTSDADGVVQTLTFPGSYWVNNGRTRSNYIRVQTRRCDYANPGIAAVILSKVQALIS